MNKVLIVDFVSTGHHAEYVCHLLRYGNSGQVAFLLADSFKDKLDANLVAEFEIYYISKEEEAVISNIENRHRRTRALWKLLDDFQNRKPFARVFFMYINYMLKPWNFGGLFYKKKYAYSGIFFQSPYPLKKLKGRFDKSLLRREFALYMLTIDPNCNGIFLLNDQEGVDYYTKVSKKIKFIPDPVHLVAPSSLNIYDYHQISPDTIVLLHIGAIGEHKGTFELLNAYRELPAKTDQKTVLLIVGKAKGEEEIKLNEQMAELNTSFVRQGSAASVMLRGEFVNDEDFSAYMDQSDLVVVANKNTEASSGIVNHVIYRGKRVVAPKSGFFKMLLEKYPNAVLYSSEFPLGDAIELGINLSVSEEIVADYIRPLTKQDEKFVDIIIYLLIVYQSPQNSR